jgi:hypothetical protein
MAHIILPQVDIVDKLQDNAKLLVEQNGEIRRFLSSNLITSNANIYEITSNSVILEELIKFLPEEVTINNGDIMLVTNTLGVKSAY